MNDKINIIKKSIMPILIRRNVAKAAIFGSTARGEEKKGSDIDILVSFKKRVSLLDLGGLKADLEEKLDKKVDVVTFSSIDKRFRKSIMEDMVLIL